MSDHLPVFCFFPIAIVPLQNPVCSAELPAELPACPEVPPGLISSHLKSSYMMSHSSLRP